MPLISTHNDISAKQCKDYEECAVVDFNNIVGQKTLEDSGFFGSLIDISYTYLNKGIKDGILDESSAGSAFANMVAAAMENAVRYELARAKSIKDAEMIHAQKEQVLLSMKLAEDEQQLKQAETNAKIKQIDNAVHIENEKLQIEKDMSQKQMNQIDCECDIKNKEIESKLKIDEKQERLLDSQRAHTDAEATTINARRGKEVELLEMQRYQIQCNCDIADKKTKSEIDLSEQQRQLVAQQRLETEAKTKSINDKRQSEINLIDKQAARYGCECDNQKATAKAQAALARRQAMGFNDHLILEYYKTKMQTMGMIFGDIGGGDNTIKSMNLGKSAKEGYTIPAIEELLKTKFTECNKSTEECNLYYDALDEDA